MVSDEDSSFNLSSAIAVLVFHFLEAAKKKTKEMDTAIEAAVKHYLYGARDREGGRHARFLESVHRTPRSSAGTSNEAVCLNDNAAQHIDCAVEVDELHDYAVEVDEQHDYAVQVEDLHDYEVQVDDAVLYRDEDLSDWSEN